MLDCLRLRIRIVGIIILIFVFVSIFGAVSYYHIRQLILQDNQYFMRNARVVQEYITKQSVIDLQQISTLENTYSMYLYLFDNKHLVSSPYTLGAGKLNYQEMAIQYSEICRDQLNQFDDSYAKSSMIENVQLIYLMSNRESGKFIELVAIQPVVWNLGWLLQNVIHIAIVCFLGCFLLVTVWWRVVNKAFEPAYAARKSQLDFLSMAGHELRTPLSIIQANTELLLLEDSKNSYALCTLSETKRLQSLVEEMLLLSRIESNTVLVRMQAIDAYPILLDCYTKFLPLCKQNHHVLVIVPPPEADTCVQADPDRVTQILEILLSNALHHTPEGTKIELGYKIKDRMISLYVSDNGPGIVNANAFVPFRHHTYHTNGSHLGVGLYIAKELAARQDAVLSAIKQQPHGVCFELTFKAL